MRSLIAFTHLIPLLLVLTGCERAKTQLDQEVDRLCTIDGGIRIYETVALSKENFGPNGAVFPQYRSDIIRGGGLGPEYQWASVKEEIVQGDPSLTRWEQKITRIKDEKILGKRTVYIRGGGDFLGPWAPSEYSCRGVSGDLINMVFFKEELK